MLGLITSKSKYTESTESSLNSIELISKIVTVDLPSLNHDDLENEDLVLVSDNMNVFKEDVPREVIELAKKGGLVCPSFQCEGQEYQPSSVCIIPVSNQDRFLTSSWKKRSRNIKGAHQVPAVMGCFCTTTRWLKYVLDGFVPSSSSVLDLSLSLKTWMYGKECTCCPSWEVTRKLEKSPRVPKDLADRVSISQELFPYELLSGSLKEVIAEDSIYGITMYKNAKTALQRRMIIEKKIRKDLLEVIELTRMRSR